MGVLYRSSLQNTSLFEIFTGKRLLFARLDHQKVEAYIDTDWVGLVTDRRSTLGYCSLVGGNLVT
jgi:hypothetical protein